MPAIIAVAKSAKLTDIDAMRKLLPFFIVLLFAPVFGQDESRTDSFSTNNWSQLAPPTVGSKGFSLFSRDIRLNRAGQYELWIKIIPASPASFNKRFDLPSNTAFVLQYTTVDCEKRLLKFEKLTVYYSSETILKSGPSTLFPTSKKDTIKRGSVGEAVYENVCVKP
ncbi:MAG: hypothetical protein M3Q26_13225 [Acidobacteriota bacterium]|jgi:hypothetical protein|nr:hypothetical protein [Acidobacteriota bacterium]